MAPYLLKVQIAGYIPKKSGKLRPLGIPTMFDRAQQALHRLALEPVYEMQAEKNVYGFRPVRSTADAIEQCFIVLAKKRSPQWIFEGDIKACFDHINHPWMMANIPTDKTVLGKWLSAGYMEKRVFYHTSKGTPQGGIISPTLMNFTLSGMEREVRAAVSKRDKVNNEATRFLNARSRRTLEQYLRWRKKQASDSPALFLSSRRQRLSLRQVQRSFEQWLKAAGIGKHLTIHSLCHTFASTLYEKSNNLLAVQQALGHRSITSTMIYTQLNPEQLTDALETL